jgi:hypothetical protein
MVLIVLGVVGHNMKKCSGASSGIKYTTMKRNKPCVQQLKKSSKQFHNYNGCIYCISTFPKPFHKWQ